MLPWERYVADRIYRPCQTYAIPPVQNDRTHIDYLQGVVRARHETVNNRLKIFKVLSDTYRHPPESHGNAFRAVANIVQIMMENGSPMYHIEGYKD